MFTECSSRDQLMQRYVVSVRRVTSSALQAEPPLVLLIRRTGSHDDSVKVDRIESEVQQRDKNEIINSRANKFVAFKKKTTTTTGAIEKINFS